METGVFERKLSRKQKSGELIHASKCVEILIFKSCSFER